MGSYFKPLSYDDLLTKIDAIQPILYAQTRNYIDGAVTRLSPYISRGVISTQQILQAIIQKGYSPRSIESFLKELAWRDYYQQVWKALGSEIDSEIKSPQQKVSNHLMPRSIIEKKTGIDAIDTAIDELYRTGYMHNHIRMYVASVCCNIAQSNWKMPAKWMYYYLLDADWASNALSWQWVAGSFSHKKYYATQQNINTYTYSQQVNTFLDVSYEQIECIAIPSQLREVIEMKEITQLPAAPPITIDERLPTYIYNFYNLDSQWDKHMQANRILLLEPSFFTKYPVSKLTIDFIIQNSTFIPHIQIFVGEFDALYHQIATSTIHFKEHPTNAHYKGFQHQRNWMFDQVQGYYPSFFAYWKKCAQYVGQL